MWSVSCHSGQYWLAFSIHPYKIYFRSVDEHPFQIQNSKQPLSLSPPISSSSPSSSIPPTQTLLISPSFLSASPVVPTPQKWQAALLSLERTVPSFPLLPRVAFRQVTHPGLQKHWWISDLLCISPASFYSPSLAATTCCFLHHRHEDAERDRQTAGERANCCYGNMQWMEFTRGGVCAATCCCWCLIYTNVPYVKQI